jgi:hypothetical protein
MRQRLEAVMEHAERADVKRPKESRLFKPTTDYMVGTKKAYEDLKRHIDKGCLSDHGSVEETFMPLHEAGPFGMQQYRRMGTTSSNESLHGSLNVVLAGRTTMGDDLMEAIVFIKVSLDAVFLSSKFPHLLSMLL